MRIPTVSATRFAILVALFLLLFSSGVVVGAAGSRLIVGDANHTEQGTTLVADTSSPALTVENRKDGAAIELRAGNNSALILDAPGDHPPLLVSTDTRVPKLNADRVDGYHASALSRFAFAAHDAANGPFIRGADDALTTEITAPRPGFLQITGHAYLYTFSRDDRDVITCSLEVGEFAVPGARVQQDLGYDADASVDMDQASCDPSGGFVVCEEGRYDVGLRFVGLNEESAVLDATLMVLYTPFGDSGQIARCDETSGAEPPLELPAK